MQLRQNKGSRPQITFTSDFHELVQGDLIPGPCLLRYDPLRLVTLGDAAQEAHQIRAYVRFHPVGGEWQAVMELPPGLPLADQADPTGEGIMLTSTFNIPEGCDELEAWFSCTHGDGQIHWDSNLGQNYWLRFGLADLSIKTAKVIAGGADAEDLFEVVINTKPEVESVKVRWRVTSSPGFLRQVTPLTLTATAPTGKTWSPGPRGSIPIPKGGTIAFDIVYYVDGREFTDDNQGRWYIAD